MDVGKSAECLPSGFTEKVKNKNGRRFKVTVESSAADDLPPDWIKETVTRKSGTTSKKDLYITDPVSGYIFRSKLDALRFVKTNDIGACVIRPKKRELSDLNLVKNENTKIHCQNPLKNTEPEYGISNEEPTETAQTKSRNSRKRKVPNMLPSLVAKSLSESEPEMMYDSDLNEQSLKATEKPSTGTEEANAYQPSDIKLSPIEVKSPQNFDFGDSWSDPLEFALKILRGDIPIDNLITLYFDKNFSVPTYNNGKDECLRTSSESDVPNIFQNKVAGTSSGLGNIGSLDFGGFNGQPSSDVGKKDNQTK